MKLQLKLSLYNTVTKIAIALLLGAVVLFSIEKIAYNQLDNRLVKKKNKIIRNLSDEEIKVLLDKQDSFTDYNILKEEFIILNDIPDTQKAEPVNIITEDREIEDEVEPFRILNYKFLYNTNWYRLEIGETIGGIDSIKSFIRFYMLILLAVALTISLFTDYAFTSWLLKPFYAIIDKKINKVNDPTLYNYENIPTTTYDFKILDESINSLMRKINELFSLEKQFIANVSHELLTPITILSTRFENMLNAVNIPPDHEDKLYASLKTLNRLKVIINSLLLISSVENHQYLKQENISIRKELLEIYEELEDRIVDKKVNYSAALNSDFKFLGSKTLIHILLTNIINNAIKYNRTGGSIVVVGTSEHNNYKLQVIDTGIGMNAEVAENAFDRFKRGNSDENGFGLGLAIVKSIADYHGIKVIIASNREDGTEITLIFSETKKLK
ncbi:signal transduction histidine kinase [Pedobacter sp. UYEF25]